MIILNSPLEIESKSTRNKGMSCESVTMLYASIGIEMLSGLRSAEMLGRAPARQKLAPPKGPASALICYRAPPESRLVLEFLLANMTSLDSSKLLIRTKSYVQDSFC